MPSYLSIERMGAFSIDKIQATVSLLRAQVPAEHWLARPSCAGHDGDGSNTVS